MWVAQSFKCPILGLGSGRDLGDLGLIPASGSVLSVAVLQTSLWNPPF